MKTFRGYVIPAKAGIQTRKLTNLDSPVKLENDILDLLAHPYYRSYNSSMYFRKILKELEKRNIKYLAIGGVAVNLYGYNRVTNDLDIMISFDLENVRKLAQMATELGLKPRVPVDIEELADSNKREYWKKEKNMKVFSIYNPENDFEIVDIMISDDIDFDTAYKNRQIQSDENFNVSVVSINDLIKLKEAAGRGRDLVDLKILKELKGRND